jgi:hypothetical protein
LQRQQLFRRSDSILHLLQPTRERALRLRALLLLMREGVLETNFFLVDAGASRNNLARLKGYPAMARLLDIFVVTVLIAGCSARVTKLPNYHGQSRAQMVAMLGEPQRDATFPMSKANGEFRVELQNIYPLSNPANATVEIEAMTWRDGDYWITLWLHKISGQWVVLDSCRWHKDVQF